MHRPAPAIPREGLCPSHCLALPPPSSWEATKPRAWCCWPSCGHRDQMSPLLESGLYLERTTLFADLLSFSPPATPSSSSHPPILQPPSSLFLRQALLTTPLHPVSRTPYFSASPCATPTAVPISAPTLNASPALLPSHVVPRALPTSSTPLSAMGAHFEACFSMC